MSAWAESRVKLKQTLDRFCGNKMWYNPIWDFGFDAELFNNDQKFIGIAKIFSKPGNFGNSPLVEISKTDLDYIYELGLLLHKKPAIIARYRNKIAYLRLDNLDYETVEGKKGTNYKIPVGQFKCV